MKSTFFKLIFIISICIILILSIPLISNAFSFGELITDVKSFESAGGNTANSKEGQLKNISNSVSNILLTIALGVTVISAAAMGINFVIQSVEDKAKIKESMVPWIIGIFVSFGAYGIWRITMGIFSGIV